MNLFDLVKRVEDAGLEVALSTHGGFLHLAGWTCVERGKQEVLFNCFLDQDGGYKPMHPSTDATITEELRLAASHPDAVERRKRVKEHESDIAKVSNAA